jgi:hypothetical protein
VPQTLRKWRPLLLEFAPGVVCVLDVEEVASPLFIPELAPGVVCVLYVEEVASSLFLPEFAPGVICAPDGHVDTVEEWRPLCSYLSLLQA